MMSYQWWDLMVAISVSIGWSDGLCLDRSGESPWNTMFTGLMYVQVQVGMPRQLPWRGVLHCLMQYCGSCTVFWKPQKWVWGCFEGLWWFMTPSKTWWLNALLSNLVRPYKKGWYLQAYMIPPWECDKKHYLPSQDLLLISLLSFLAQKIACR